MIFRLSNTNKHTHKEINKRKGTMARVDSTHRFCWQSFVECACACAFWSMHDVASVEMWGELRVIISHKPDHSQGQILESLSIIKGPLCVCVYFEGRWWCVCVCGVWVFVCVRGRWLGEEGAKVVA